MTLSRGLALLLAAALVPVSPATAADPARLIAVGDVHGAYDEFSGLLRRVGLIDAAGHWSGGSTQLVSLGDLTDRGPDSRKVMDLLMQLEAEAPRAGGVVRVVLGNHEVMNLTGEWRDVSAGEVAAFAGEEKDDIRQAMRDRYVARHVAAGRDAAAAGTDFERLFPRGWFARRAAFAPDGTYGRWLLDRPALIKAGDTLFLHAGLSRVATGYTLEALNAAFASELRGYLAAVAQLEAAGWFGFEDATDARAVAAKARLDVGGADPALAAAAQKVLDFERSPLMGIQGPVWYRGLAICQPLPQEDILDAVLAHFGAKRIVVGHTTTRDSRIVTRFDGRVLMVDTGMLKAVYKGRPSALEITTAGLRALYADGTEAQPQPDPRPAGFSSFANSDALRESVLRAATVVAVDPGPAPRRMVHLDYQGTPVQAWFLSDPGPTRGRKGRWQYEVAAYKLDRLAGFWLVPPAVERELEGAKGALQWRIEAIAASDPAGTQPTTTPWCAAEQQLELMYEFDALIGNEQRTLDSFGYTKDDWLLLSTDQRFAFGTGKALPAHLKTWKPQFGPATCRRFAALDQASVTKALGPSIKPGQVKALLTRRDTLLKQAACSLQER
jgi:hypothetical protein